MKLLLDQDKITENFTTWGNDSKVEEFGPFINLGKGVVIPHARPDEGVEWNRDVTVSFGRTDLFVG